MMGLFLLRLMGALQRHAILAMMLSLGLGIAWQDLAAMFHPYLVQISVACMLLSLCGTRISGVMSALRRPGFAAAIIVWTLIVLPAMALLVGRAIDMDPVLRIGLITMLAAPPMVSVAAYGLILGTNTTLLLGAVIPATIISGATMPLIMSQIPGAPADGQLLALIQRALAMVAIAIAGALAVRRGLSLDRGNPRAREVLTACDGLTIVFICATAIAVTANLQAVLLAEPWLCAGYLAAALLVNIAVQATTTALFWRAGRETALSAAMISGNRNMAFVIGLFAGYAEPPLQLFLAMAQLHLFFMPAIMRPPFRGLGLRPASAKTGS